MRRPLRIFALDFGTTKVHPTGWAWTVGAVVRSGQISLESRTRKSPGDRHAYFRDWMLERIEEVGPDLIAYEMPPLAKGGIQGRLTLLGLVVLVDELAARWGIDTARVAPATLKKALTGKGNAEKKTVQISIERLYPCQAPFEGPDQVDALAVLEWARVDVLGLEPRGKAGEC